MPHFPTKETASLSSRDMWLVFLIPSSPVPSTQKALLIYLSVGQCETGRHSDREGFLLKSLLVLSLHPAAQTP